MKNRKSIFMLLSLALTALTFSLESQSKTTLEQLQEDYWQNQLKESLYLRMKFGLRVERLPDFTPAYAKKQTDFARSLLERLRKFDASSLDEEDWTTLQVLLWENEMIVQSEPFFWHTNPVTPYASPLPIVHRVFQEFSLETQTDLEHYLYLAAQYPSVIGEIEHHLKGQLKRNIVLPQEELELVLRFLRGFTKKSEQSLFWVDGRRLGSFEAARIENFHKRLRPEIDSRIVPALERLISFVAGDYQKAAPKTVGLSQYPEGKDYYRYLVRFHTTMDVVPEDIHRVGLREVERLERQMEEVRARTGFEGSKQDFRKFLKTDPRFFATTPEQAGQKLMSFIYKIEPKIGQFFTKIPRAPYGVRRLDPALEGAMTFGYYQEPTKQEPKGYYFYNGSNLKERSLLNAGSLMYHELVPGHHFQLALQSENTSLTPFRRNSFSTAFVEGWAEYASQLAGELGMYDDPYDHYGRLSSDMFLTSRLVVDTGMNHLGWSRSRAVEFLRERLLMSDTEIETETLRYCCDIPGQALAYKMGSRKILELRSRAKQALGERFDIRDFHDLILSGGSLPMHVLEKRVDRFIQKNSNRAKSDS